MTTLSKTPVENTSAREIVITRIFDAPRELVWDVMTDPRHVVNWWGPRGFSTTIGEMDFRVGGTWKQVMHGPDGANYPNEHLFQEIVIPERIVFSQCGRREAGAGVNFLATWTFDAVETGRTRVTNRMLFPSASERNFVVQEFGAIEGGQQTLERLDEYLAKMTVKPFVISREFNAPRQLVWKVWTEREHLMNWFGPRGCAIEAAKLDFRAGGVFHYCMATRDGNKMWGRFVYREIVPPRKIVLVNSFADEAGGLRRNPFSDTWPLEMLTTTRLAENAGKTILTIESVPIRAKEAECQTFDSMRGSMQQGWTGTFQQLEEYLAKVP